MLAKESIDSQIKPLYELNDLTAWLDLTTYCNARCPQCHRNDPNGLGKAKWLPLVQWNLEQFKKAYPPSSMKIIEQFEICGTWGDPIMVKDIYEICSYIIHNSDCKIQINTNGGVRDKNWWFTLGVLGYEDRIRVIFDVEGINQEMHSKYRRNVDFNKLCENAREFTSAGGEAEGHIIVFKHNEDYVEEITDMCLNKLGMRNVIVQYSNRFFDGPVFEFLDEQGNKQTLEEAVNKNHEGVNPETIARLRDHKWWKEAGKNRNRLNNHG